MRSASRRHFMKGLLAAASAPLFIPAHVLRGAAAPSRKIQLGHIGVGGQGTGNLRNFLGVPGAASVAICDPFQERREKAAGFVREQQGHTPKLYGDFRDLLADPGIDAVVICTPDHWHVPVALAAIRAGKDLYLEKPLGYSLEQNRLLRDALARLVPSVFHRERDRAAVNHIVAAFPETLWPEVRLAEEADLEPCQRECPVVLQHAGQQKVLRVGEVDTRGLVLWVRGLRGLRGLRRLRAASDHRRREREHGKDENDSQPQGAPSDAPTLHPQADEWQRHVIPACLGSSPGASYDRRRRARVRRTP